MLGPALVQAVDFKRDIAPILKKHCYECHVRRPGKMSMARHPQTKAWNVSSVPPKPCG